MSTVFHIVVCASLVPDPLQTLDPVSGPEGPALKNESMLPSILDPWGAHALYEADHLAARHPESRVWLVGIGPKVRFQQLMMIVAQRARFELVLLDGPASGFTDASAVSARLAEAIPGIEGLDLSRLLLFGGCASASRDAGVTLPMVGERLGIRDQFLAVDELRVEPDGALRILERIDGGRYLASVVPGPPAVVGWATGRLAEPSNSPQLGMQNMRLILPALQKARPAEVGGSDLRFLEVSVPSQRRETRIVKDASADDIAAEIVEWIRS